jgi:hypothetical protein
MHAADQRAEVVLQMTRVLGPGLSVDPRRAVLARASVGFAKPVDVDVMSQRRERKLRRCLRQRRYSIEFR